MVSAMISQATFYGGADFQSISVDYTLTRNSRVWTIDATVTGLNVRLPSTYKTTTGGPWFYIINAGNLFNVVTNDGATTLLALAAGHTAIALLSSTWKVVDRG